jgi:hypothetical protein
MKLSFAYKAFTLILSILLFTQIQAQENVSDNNLGVVSGNVSIIAQQYTNDSLIGATAPPEKMAMNAFTNILYRKGKFNAGMRIEAYYPSLLGYPEGFNGAGIGYYFAEFKSEKLTVTAGTFYEQFGSGMALRTYEENTLGLDNSILGVRVKYNAGKGVYLKGVYGTQRYKFDYKIIPGPGIVRGFDAEWQINDAFESMADDKIKFNVGGSFVSKYQQDKDPILIMPENVGNSAGRFSMFGQHFNFSTEYVYKINDPSADNGYIYKNGQGLMFNLNFFKKGFGLALAAKSTDNMSYRSDRNVGLNYLLINYNPALTKPHTYLLVATLYPYATNLNGEVAFQGDLTYKFAKKTKLGGKYGTNIAANFSIALAPERTYLNDMEGSRIGYETKLFAMTDSLFYSDFNISIYKKFTKKFKAKITYFNIAFNADANLVTETHGMVYSNTFVFEGTYKITPKQSLRLELQGLFTKQDRGDWAAAVIEYTISPHWFFALIDQYNFGNSDPNERIHYLYGTAGYIHNSTRISLAYGRQREGIFCVGGVCRAVPASNGFNLTITSSF